MRGPIPDVPFLFACRMARVLRHSIPDLRGPTSTTTLNSTDDRMFDDLYQRLLEAAREIARRNRSRIDDLRRRFDLPEDLMEKLDGNFPPSE